MDQASVMPPDHAHSAAKAVVDAISIGVVIGALSELLPPLAALATLVWTCIRIYESRTVQRWLGRHISAGETDE